MTQKPPAPMPISTSNAGFVHLHVHSAYSLLKGSIKIQKLAELAKADRQPALALTDTDNMFGALEFSDKLAGYGIQPIIGCELAVDFGDQDPNARTALAAGPRAGRLRHPAHHRLRAGGGFRRSGPERPQCACGGTGAGRAAGGAGARLSQP